NFPVASLAGGENHVLSTFFTALTHCNGDKHVEAASLVGDLAENLNAQWLQFHISQAGPEDTEKEFTNGGGSAYRRKIGTQNQSIGDIEADELLKVLPVAGERPIGGRPADGRLCAARQAATGRGGLDFTRGRGRAGHAARGLT